MTKERRRLNVIRDGVAALLVILGLLLPWSVHFGIGIAGTVGWVFGLLVLATLLSLAALAVSHVGPRRLDVSGADLRSLAGLRLALNAPYLVMVVGFVGFTVVQSIRYGGTASVPPGIGPGAWLGVAGALLVAQPVITATDDDGQRHWVKTCRVIGIVSLVLALGAVLFNLYWRTRFVLPNIFDPDTAPQHTIVVVAAVMYGVVAVAPVVIAARWIISGDRPSRLATVLLGASTLVAGAFVWILPVGRDLDAFHGIAEDTSTAGVGFEGYLAWAAAAAIFGSATVLGALTRKSAASWRAAARKCLLLIAVWCAGTAVLRVIDVMSSAVLDLPAPPYNSTALMAFDLVAAVLAVWLYLNSASRAAPRLLMMLLFGVLFVLTVVRLIVGLALVPRVQPLNATDINDVYGNTLSQQITSTFDVALCVLALALLAISVALANEMGILKRQPRPVAQEAETSHSVVPTEHWARPEAQPGDRVAEELAESTQRFAAGTTYRAVSRKPPQ